jgi:hypothetical protein
MKSYWAFAHSKPGLGSRMSVCPQFGIDLNRISEHVNRLFPSFGRPGNGPLRS